MLRRIVVIGAAGSGKSTLAGAVSARLRLPHIELDEIFWGPNWTAMPVDQFRARVSETVAGDAWVAAGNYTSTRDVLWARADTLVWLDLPLPLILWRLLRRTLKRVIRRETLWGGNHETWREAFFSRESLFPYAVKQHARFRRELPTLVAQTYPHVTVVRLRTPREVTTWLEHDLLRPTSASA